MRAPLLARLSLALLSLLAVGAFGPLASPAAAQPAVSQLDRCRADLAVGTRRYLEHVLTARVRCEIDVIKGKLPVSTDCRTGRGDARTDARLRAAEDALTNVGAACNGVNLILLGFPGVCTDYTGDPFDTADVQRCVLDQSNQTVEALLDKYFPPITDFYRGAAAQCLKGSAVDATKSLKRVLRVREACLLGQQFLNIDQSVECREEILPYGPGTGDADIDRGIGRGYIRLLGAIPAACVTVQIDDLGYQGACEDQTGGLFTIFDLKDCLFRQNRVATLASLGIIFPTDPVCGDGVKAGDEQCDDGLAGNSNTTPDACRTDCTLPKCHDGVKDPGNNEQCDDGNLVDGDCCSGECILDTCGDGTRNCTEQCDNGGANSNTVPNACRANCTNPSCGDGVTDTGEECDDGNKASNDGCSAACLSEYCGDELVQSGLGEECDNGIDNADAPDACRTDCTSPRCGDGITDPSNGEDCDDGNSIDTDGCTNGCTICGDNVRKGTEECDGTDLGTCGGGEACNGTCACEKVCPTVGELRLFAGVGRECSTNADCPVGTCDGGRCRTETRLDSGWVGLAHNADINDDLKTRGYISCDSHGPTCGQCNLTGLDPSLRSCRCANDLRKVCDQPFAADANDCGGATCECYFGAPFPLSSGGTPACVVNRFSQDISGTANVDLGEGLVVAKLRTKVFLGISTSNPCPTCGGKCSNDATKLCDRSTDCASGGTCNLDPTPDDGVRGGVCINGDMAGQTCDATTRNTSFPAFNSGTNGGWYSLDCMPSAGKNISGSGLIINLSQTTGTATLNANVSCGGQSPELSCPCLQCSGDTEVPCNVDSDCAGQQGSCALASAIRCSTSSQCAAADVGPCKSSGRCTNRLQKTCASNADCLNFNAGACNPSTCSSDNKGGFPLPNQCDDGLCVDDGSGSGRCNTGPDERSCDGVVKANGSGILACGTNADCAAGAVGVDAGNCTVVERRACFLDPIVAVGKANPSTPLGAATFCVPPTANVGINSVAGLPGPGRIINQAKSRTFCGNDPTKQYIPGVGGCMAD